MENRQASNSRSSVVAEIETPGYQERVFFVGANGSGKSVLASQMLAAYDDAIVFDVKGDFHVPWPEGTYSVFTRPPNQGFLNWFGWRSACSRIVYRPTRPYDSGKYAVAFLDWCFDRARRAKGERPFVLYLDEGGWMAYAGAREAIARLAISGRSLNLGLWIAAQRPRGIPVEVRSEAWRWYVFYLRSLADRDEIVSYLDYHITEQELESSTLDYQFWEIRRGQGGRMQYRRLPPIKLASSQANWQA